MVCLQCFDAVGWATGGHPVYKKTERWGAGMVICLEQGADLHMSQLMPLPLTVSCRVVPDKALLNGCVCVCVYVCARARVWFALKSCTAIGIGDSGSTAGMATGISLKVTLWVWGR